MCSSFEEMERAADLVLGGWQGDEDDVNGSKSLWDLSWGLEWKIITRNGFFPAVTVHPVSVIFGL